jgi:hypothetical protein
VEGIVTEIRTFFSIKEIREQVESEINQSKILLEDYSQWLGTLLRNPESSKDQEWAKKTAELQKIFRSGGKKIPKKEDKKDTSTEWVQFKDLTLSAENVGEAEMLFEAVEELKNKNDKLEKAKNSLTDLERYGLGKDLLYITYVHNGVPEKIVFKPKNEIMPSNKFNFAADFSVVKQDSPNDHGSV